MKVVDIPTSKKPVITEGEFNNFVQLHTIVAKVRFNYYKNLIDAGYDPRQALEIIKVHKFY